MNLRLKQVSMSIASFTLELDLELHHHTTAIFGPSGAGKTSLLDLIAGLRRPQSAFIQLDDRVLTDTAQRIEIPTRHRQIGYVPQDLALFPHLSVRDNLLYGSKQPAAAHPALNLEHVIDVLEIGNLIHRSVLNLSGGEKQRVTLARALLASPQLLLLDEPLGSLDLKLKARLIPYLNRIRAEFPVPMLYVTHDPDEVAALCDEVVVLANGRCSHRGPPATIFRQEQQLRFVLNETAHPPL